MAVSIPGLSLSILRQQTSIQSGLPLLISGRFTAFGLGVPAFIRVFLEGPSYDPQVRSFDTFASPFSGDYSVNVIAEKDGQFNVYAQAFPPPIIPTGPPFPEAIMLLPPMAESTHPPLVVGIPYDGGVESLLPDGTTERLTNPTMTPIEVQSFVTVGAPAVSITIPGIGAVQVPTYPYYPEVPAAPAAPAVPAAPAAAVTASVDNILFTPNMINPGMEATGVMTWRNTGTERHNFDLVFYLLSPQGVSYGPLQVNQNISANPMVPNTHTIRLSTTGLPSVIYSMVAEIYDSDTGALITSRILGSRLQIREIAPPVVPEVPPPVVPKKPTIEILGTPTLNLPHQITVGDIWSGSVSLPTLGAVPYFVEGRLVLRDLTGFESIAGQGGRTLQAGETLQVPVSLNTSGFAAGNYTILLRIFDQVGQQITEFSMGVLSMIAAVVPPVPIPPVAPTLPTADLFGTPSVNLPTQLEIGELLQGNVSIPTVATPTLLQLPSLPSYPLNMGLQLQDPAGKIFNIGTYHPTFTPGQTITLPVSYDTSVLSREGFYNIIMSITDIQGNRLFENIIGTLSMLAAAIPEIPPVPVPPPPEVPLPKADIAQWDIRVTTAGPYDPGDTVNWVASGVYKGRAQKGQLTISLGLGSFAPIILKFTMPIVPVNFAASVDWAPFNLSGAFTIPANVERNIRYTLQARIEGLEEATQETDQDFNVLQITAGPPAPPAPPALPAADIANFDFQITSSGPYNPGDSISWIAPGVYKGRAQKGQLTISMGTGIAPSFITRFTLTPVTVSFNESSEWAPFNFNGAFTVPAGAELGQTYSVRARIEALQEPTQETDTDYGAIEMAAAPVLEASRFTGITCGLTSTTVRRGDTLRVPVYYSHIGKEEPVILYAAIGKVGVFGFDEQATARKYITVPDDVGIQFRTEYVEMPIPANLRPGTYDAYVKIIRYLPKLADVISPTVRGVVTVVGA